MTSRACWYTAATIIWALALASGLLFGPASAWQSTSYDVLRFVPPSVWAVCFGVVAALGTVAIVEHHHGSQGRSMEITRWMAVVATGVSAAWLIGFLAAWALGLLAGWSALGSWAFALVIHMEASGMGGRRDIGRPDVGQ
jgi:hypothetical protein